MKICARSMFRNFLLSPTLLLTCVLVSSTGCGTEAPSLPGTAEMSPESTPLDPIAESYVRLVLAVGQHDSDYVDAFYGPEAWKTEAAASPRSLDEIRAEGVSLVAQLGVPRADEMLELRRRYLARQLEALISRVDMLGGQRWSFDEESRALYDAVAPTRSEAHFQTLLDELDKRLTAEGFVDGSLHQRFEAFRTDFVIPPEKLDAVFQRAIDACRQRTAAHIELPPGESFEVEYVSDQPWSGYNWYQGGFRSLIQVNTDFPIYIDRAIDLACHEGYPGHHVYNALLEQHLGRDRGWVESSIYPLFSPQSLIAEGSANFGIEMAFPGEERLAFERDVLFPLAGLDPQRAEIYSSVQEAIEGLGYAGNEAARRYLDGEIDADGAAEWLTTFAVSEPDRARQRVAFFDRYRSYVINYNLGQDLVRSYVETKAGNDPDERWRIFAELLSTPRLPSDLR